VNTFVDPVGAYRAELRASATRALRARRRRLLIVAAAVAVGVLMGSLAIAATSEGWLTGEPAPPKVVEGSASTRRSSASIRRRARRSSWRRTAPSSST
jgi:hypothetical protein